MCGREVRKTISAALKLRGSIRDGEEGWQADGIIHVQPSQVHEGNGFPGLRPVFILIEDAKDMGLLEVRQRFEKFAMRFPWRVEVVADQLIRYGQVGGYEAEVGEDADIDKGCTGLATLARRPDRLPNSHLHRLDGPMSQFL
ncbi:hypothetical protein B0H14DRAFT_2621411 [Mycena olivaceomarginata]|nr:hypothetical protein B0H14DRAFT_2621411 [Mycena olivaceomarginata]